MHHKHYLILLPLMHMACTSAPKNEVTPSAHANSATTAETNSQTAPTATSTTVEAVLANNGLRELVGVAAALTAISDQNSKPEAEREAVLNCNISLEQATAYKAPLRALIAKHIDAERDAYVRDVVTYSQNRALETCAAHCACATLSEIVEPVSLQALKNPREKRLHARNLKRLQIKAAHQASADILGCGRRQSWFCQSDLKSYLDAEAAKNDVKP